MEALLERDEVIGRLAGDLADAAAGRGRMVFLSGEAGVGKTALVRRFGDGKAVLRKLEASTRQEAVVAARRLGIFEDR